VTEGNCSIPDPLKQQKLENRPLPNPDICRAQQVLPTLVECLVLNARRCRYAMPFGHGVFCQNPHAKQIAARTKAAGKTSGGK